MYQLMSVNTLLNVAAWEDALRSHPDRAYARYVCEGLRYGSRVGFCRSSPLKSATANMPSTRLHPQVITKYIEDEKARDRMLGPFPLSMRPAVHVNRFGVIPKGNTGKFRLSFPHGQSVNDGIDPNLCSLSYSSVDDEVEIVARLGRGVVLAKVDIESAYRIPRTANYKQWSGKGRYNVDPMMPFGLRSAPKVFNVVVDALNWYLHQESVRYCLHYLDDFIIVGRLDSTMRYADASESPLQSISGMARRHAWSSWELCVTRRQGSFVFRQTRCSICSHYSILGETRNQGAGISDWPPQSCVQSGETRALIPPQDDRPLPQYACWSL